MRRILWVVLAGLLAVPGFGQTIEMDLPTTVNIHLRSATTGADITGATITGITGVIYKHSDTLTNAATAFTCAGSASTHDCVEKTGSKGVYNIEIPAADVDQLGLWTICVSYTGAETDCVDYEVVAEASVEANRRGNLGDGTALLAAIAAVQTDTDDIQLRLPADIVMQKTTIATLSTQVSFTLTAGSTDNLGYPRNAIVVITDQSTATQKAVAILTNYVGSTRTVTLLAAPAFTIAVGDTVAILPIRVGI